MNRAPNCARMVLANTANTSNRSYLQRHMYNKTLDETICKPPSI